MISTIFMTIIYMAIAGSAIFIWMNINTEIINNMNEQDCKNSITKSGDGVEKTVDSVQSLYIWLTIIAGLAFLGLLKGFKGIAEGSPVFNPKEIFPVIYMAGTMIAIFIAAFSIRLNPIIENMATDYRRIRDDGSDGDILKPNTMVGHMLTVLTVVPSIAMVGILHKGYQLLETEGGKKDGEEKQAKAHAQAKAKHVQSLLDEANATSHVRSERAKAMVKGTTKQGRSQKEDDTSDDSSSSEEEGRAHGRGGSRHRRERETHRRGERRRRGQ
jgi:hypothetical protein